MSRSTAALLIAIMFHMLLILGFTYLIQLKPEKVEEAKEHRIKLSLKEMPKSPKKSAVVKNKLKPQEKAPPVPMGKQLEKLSLPPKRTESKPINKPKPSKQEPVKKEFKAEAPVKKLIQIKDPEKTEEIQEKKAEKKSALYNFLSKKQKSKVKSKTKTQSGTQVGSDFKEAYGEAFGRLTEGEKKYLIDNQEIMRRITQEQLNRLGPVNIPRNLNVDTVNYIEFYLYPNGDISGLKIIDSSGFQILDDTSLQTIEYSYHRYPLPKEKTLIRYKVGYNLGGRRY